MSRQAQQATQDAEPSYAAFSDEEDDQLQGPTNRLPGNQNLQNGVAEQRSASTVVVPGPSRAVWPAQRLQTGSTPRSTGPRSTGNPRAQSLASRRNVTHSAASTPSANRSTQASQRQHHEVGNRFATSMGSMKTPSRSQQSRDLGQYSSRDVVLGSSRAHKRKIAEMSTSSGLVSRPEESQGAYGRQVGSSKARKVMTARSIDASPKNEPVSPHTVTALRNNIENVSQSIPLPTPDPMTSPHPSNLGTLVGGRKARRQRAQNQPMPQNMKHKQLGELLDEVPSLFEDDNPNWLEEVNGPDLIQAAAEQWNCAIQRRTAYLVLGELRKRRGVQYDKEKRSLRKSVLEIRGELERAIAQDDTDKDELGDDDDQDVPVVRARKVSAIHDAVDLDYDEEQNQENRRMHSESRNLAVEQINTYHIDGSIDQVNQPSPPQEQPIQDPLPTTELPTIATSPPKVDAAASTNSPSQTFSPLNCRPQPISTRPTDPTTLLNETSPHDRNTLLKIRFLSAALKPSNILKPLDIDLNFASTTATGDPNTSTPTRISKYLQHSPSKPLLQDLEQQNKLLLRALSEIQDEETEEARVDEEILRFVVKEVLGKVGKERMQGWRREVVGV